MQCTSAHASSRLAADTTPVRPSPTLSSSTYSQPDADDDKYAKQRNSSTRANALLHSIAWLSAAALLTYYSRLVPTVLHDARIQRSALYTGAAALLVAASAFLHLAFVVPRRSPGSDDLYSLSPNSVHAALLSGVAAFGCWSAALWPVYGFAAPAMLFVLGMAAVLSTNCLPV